MFDTETMISEALSKVGSAVERCRAGRFTVERGARAQVILLSEAQTIVARQLRDTVKFDLHEFPAYVEAFPNLLSAYVGPGVLADVLTEELQRQIQNAMSETLMETVHAQRSGGNLDELFEGLDEGLRETLEPIRHFYGDRLKFAMRECRDAPGIETLKQLEAELSRQADEMLTLIHRLDIADPPTCDYAGRGRRLLLEAADQINLVLKLNLVEEFCSPALSEVRP